MHYALDHHVPLAGCEKPAQLQLRISKDAGEQLGEAPMISAPEGRRGCLAEDRLGLQAQRARRVQLVERGANGSEPADVENLDQKLACHALRLLPAPPRLFESGQLAPKLVHATRVKQYPAFEHGEVHQLA